MNATLKIDGRGRLILPKAMRERLHLRAGAKLRAEIITDKIELTPEPDARIERRGNRLVIVGGPAFDAAEAVNAAREDSEQRLASKFRRK